MKKPIKLILTGIFSLSLGLTSCDVEKKEEPKKEDPVVEYSIKFVDEDETLLSTLKVKEGDMPAYDKALPTKPSTAQYEYSFKKWSPDLAAASADATYTATYTQTTRKYTISFISEGTTLQTSQVEYGATPTYNGATPSKQATAQHSYTFDGWDHEIAPVTGNATYNATFNETLNSYTVEFVSGDTVLQSETLAYGAIPEYKGEEPTKESVDGYTYTFDGWDHEIATVTEDATYSATFIEKDPHGIYTETGKMAGASKISNFAMAGTTLLFEETPAKGFDNVFGKVGASNGSIGADLDISGYTSLYFAVSQSMSYAYLFGGDNNYATLWQDDWYQVVLERDEDFAWHAFYKKVTEEEWNISKIDDADQHRNNLKDLLKIYNWEKEGETPIITSAMIMCSEVYALDNHTHKVDEYGFCQFCGELANAEKVMDCAIKDATLTNETALSGFDSVYTITGLSNGVCGASCDITGYKLLYFELWHDIGHVFVFGGGDKNPVLWKEDWYQILMLKGDDGWYAYYKKALYETEWTTNRSKVDGANDTNFSSILRLYNWGALSTANVKCTEVYGILA